MAKQIMPHLNEDEVKDVLAEEKVSKRDLYLPIPPLLVDAVSAASKEPSRDPLQPRLFAGNDCATSYSIIERSSKPGEGRLCCLPLVNCNRLKSRDFYSTYRRVRSALVEVRHGLDGPLIDSGQLDGQAAQPVDF